MKQTSRFKWDKVDRIQLVSQHYAYKRYGRFHLRYWYFVPSVGGRIKERWIMEVM